MGLSRLPGLGGIDLDLIDHAANSLARRLELFQDLDDAIGLGIQARHLEVDPDQIVSFQGVTRQRSGQGISNWNPGVLGGTPDGRL